MQEIVIIGGIVLGVLGLLLVKGEDGHDRRCGGGGAAESVVGNISSVIQTVLAAQLVTRGGLLGETDDGQKM